MRKFYILCAAGLMFFTQTAFAQDVMRVAANLGSQLGKATYCNFPTDEFSGLSGKALDSLTTYGTPERGQAITQYMTAAEMAAKSGPVVEDCSEFRKGYMESLKFLRERY